MTATKEIALRGRKGEKLRRVLRLRTRARQRAEAMEPPLLPGMPDPWSREYFKGMRRAYEGSAPRPEAQVLSDAARFEPETSGATASQLLDWANVTFAREFPDATPAQRAAYAARMWERMDALVAAQSDKEGSAS